MQVCTSLQTDNHASTPPLGFFTGRMPFLPPNQQRQSTEGIILAVIIKVFYMHLVTVCVHFLRFCHCLTPGTTAWRHSFYLTNLLFWSYSTLGSTVKAVFFTSWMLFLSYLKGNHSLAMSFTSVYLINILLTAQARDDTKLSFLISVCSLVLLYLHSSALTLHDFCCLTAKNSTNSMLTMLRILVKNLFYVIVRKCLDQMFQR